MSEQHFGGNPVRTLSRGFSPEYIAKQEVEVRKELDKLITTHGMGFVVDQLVKITQATFNSDEPEFAFATAINEVLEKHTS